MVLPLIQSNYVWVVGGSVKTRLTADWQTDHSSIWSSLWPFSYKTLPPPAGRRCHLQLGWFLPLFAVINHCAGECWLNGVSRIEYQMLGWGRVECGGLGCTQFRSDGFGLRLSLSESGWDWLAPCLCRFGRGRPGGKPPIGSAMCRIPAPFGWSREQDGNRHHTRAAVISQPHSAPTNQPPSQPQAAGHLPHAPSAQLCFYSYRATVCITAVSRGRRVWRCLDHRDSQASDADVVSCWRVCLHFRRAATSSLQSLEARQHQIYPSAQSCQEGKPWSDGSRISRTRSST